MFAPPWLLAYLHYVLGCACLLPNGTGSTIRSIRCRHSSNIALPPTARKSAVLLRNRRQRTEPETFQNERKCRRGADCIICSGVCNTAGAHSETSCIVADIATGVNSLRGDSVTKAHLGGLI